MRKILKKKTPQSPSHAIEAHRAAPISVAALFVYQGAGISVSFFSITANFIVKHSNAIFQSFVDKISAALFQKVLKAKLGS